MRFFKRNILWIIYFLFVIVMVAIHTNEHPFISNGPYAIGKPLIWIMLIAFISYSIYCNNVENFFRSVNKINQFHWGRQIGIDLYISMFLSLCLIYLNEGSIVVLLVWLVPVIIYANLVVLLYIALNYDLLLSHFL